MIKLAFKSLGILVLICITVLFYAVNVLATTQMPDIGYLEEIASKSEIDKWIDHSFNYNDSSVEYVSEGEIITFDELLEDIALGSDEKGDVNKDGFVTSEDALMCLKASVGILDMTYEEQYLCDVSEDGYVTSDDALQILKMSVGIIDSYSTVDGSSYRVTDPYTAYNSDKLEYEIKAMPVRYYGAIDLTTIGETANGKDIYLMKLGKGDKKVLYVGTVHGSENINTAFLMRMAECYAYCYETKQLFNGRKVYDLLNEYTIYIVPMVNPDGTDKTVNGGITWKANGNGVDLNDNFPTSRWKDLNNGVKAPADKNYKGPFGGSENETKALMKLCNENSFLFMLSFHSKGEVIYWKDTLSNDIPGAKELTQKVVDSCGYRAMSATTNVNGFAGGFENWFREAYNRPGLCVETTPSSETLSPKLNSKFDSIVWNKACNVGLDVLVK